MFHPKIIDFFQRHNLYDKEMFTYIARQCQFVDYYDSDENWMVSCPPRVNHYTHIIEGFSLVLPYVWDETTLMVSIHELCHAIYWYKNLGKKYNEKKDSIGIELFPMLAERTYVEENPTPGLIYYEQFLDRTVDEKSKPEYRFALSVRDNFTSEDLDDFNKLDKSVKKQARKWRRYNR